VTEVTDADKLAAHAANLISTISERNLKSNKTGDILVWRQHVMTLALELEYQYPGLIAATRAARSAL
jgi:hypothetical protein